MAGWRPRWRRRCARVVLLDPAGRVLLLHLDASSDPAGAGYWYLPGGGRMPFESVEAAARRELREETGIADAVIGPVLGVRADVSFMFRGRRVVQDETYVAGRAPTARVGSGRHGDGERRAVAAHRWWDRADLARTSVPVFPPGLVSLVEQATAWAEAIGRTG